ncbi:SAS-6 [Lepeophtheirus salmonis]|uniref:SAS-6 n=1 Tax=Lepeophtheirus salmonis TaxID=72036 RepID=A0A7R8CXJ4_LEPSM|nr:SAS-6 [Lepeophtheirus salmonis]CAF2931477.1 SAS-6 [Lepeophtheirus salmonis]
MNKSRDLWIWVQDLNKSESKKKISLTIRESDNVSRGKKMELELMDEDDPFFFYSLTLTDSDFQYLKSQQGLLVDFHAFPSMIFQLVDKCIEESSKETPHFTSVLVHSPSEIYLEFKEINPFRHLTHLCLLSRLVNLEEELNRKTTEAEDYRKKSEKLMKDAVELQASYSSSLSKELAVERERSESLAKEISSKYDNERRSMMDNHLSSTRSMENRIASLDYENKDLSEKRHRYEATIQRMSEELRLSREKGEAFQRELENKKMENNNLDAGYHDRERMINQLKLKVGLLETEKERTEVEFRQQQDLCTIANEQKNKLDLELKEKIALISKRENAVRSVTQELMKANEIIKKFQEQARSQHQKVQLGSNVVQEQERLLSEKETELESIRTQLKSIKEKQNSMELQSQEFELNDNEKNRRIEELDKQIKTNETVIHWLNKQLTTAQARDPGLRLAPAPDGTGFSLMASSTPVVDVTKNRNLHKDILARKLAVSVGSPFLEEKKNKENLPGGSLDPKYFQSSTTLNQTPKINGSNKKEKKKKEEGNKRNVNNAGSSVALTLLLPPPIKRRIQLLPPLLLPLFPPAFPHWTECILRNIQTDPPHFDISAAAVALRNFFSSHSKKVVQNCQLRTTVASTTAAATVVTQGHSAVHAGHGPATVVATAHGALPGGQHLVHGNHAGQIVTSAGGTTLQILPAMVVPKIEVKTEALAHHQHQHAQHQGSAIGGGGGGAPIHISGNQKAHIENVHRVELQKSGDKSDEWRCVYCSKVLSTKGNLKTHVENLHGDGKKDWLCSFLISGTSPSQPSSLDLQPHQNEWRCEFCYKILGSKSALKTHINALHANELGLRKAASWTCQICYKALSSKAALLTHIQIVHEKRRDFKCDHCPQTFSSQNLLKTHIKADHQKNNLQPHTTQVLTPTSGAEAAAAAAAAAAVAAAQAEHNSQSYYCEFCPRDLYGRPTKLFAHPKDLQGHMYTEHGVTVAVPEPAKDEKCHICPKIFPRREDLQAHLAKDHGYGT